MFLMTLAYIFGGYIAVGLVWSLLFWFLFELGKPGYKGSGGIGAAIVTLLPWIWPILVFSVIASFKGD
jgi:hypothetical protein